ncbi:MAG: hypothetical protein V7752_05290 [Halopseudomonas sp.]
MALLIPDSWTSDITETLIAAEELINNGFKVMVLPVQTAITTVAT